MINIGILGAANIALKSVIPALLSHADFKIVAVASLSKSLPKSLPVKLFDSYENLLNTEEIDLIYIPLPTGLHYNYIKKAILAGKHVWCEKSFTTNYNDSLELVQLAEQNDIFLLESFQFRFHNQLERIKEIISSNKIGELRLFRSFFGFPPFNDESNIRYIQRLGGGALLDAGAYPVRAILEFIPDEIVVLSASLNKTQGKEVDIYGSAHLTTLNSKIDIQIAFGFDNYYQNGLEIWGSEGKAFTNRLFTAPKNLTPVLQCETSFGTEIISLPKDDHFQKILDYISLALFDKKTRQFEYLNILRQSKIISEIKYKAYNE